MVSVALLVRRPILQVHQTAKDTFALDPQASDASADPDAVRLAVGRPAQCPVAVRGCLLSASADAPEPKDVSPFQEMPLRGARTKVVRRFQCLAQRLDQNVARVQVTAGAPVRHLQQDSR
jgi:hypothetical protein